MLEFYFLFATWSYASLCDDALYNRTKSRRHVSIQDKVISIYQKLNMVSAAILEL